MAHLPPGSVLDMHDPQVSDRAKGLGIRSVPAVVIDGKLADCCTGRGQDEAALARRVAVCCDCTLPTGFSFRVVGTTSLFASISRA
jgi:hypothetical protein